MCERAHGTNLIVGQELRPQDEVLGVVRLLVREGANCHGGDVLARHEGDLPVLSRGVDLSFVTDRAAVLLLGEVLYRALISNFFIPRR